MLYKRKDDFSVAFGTKLNFVRKIVNTYAKESGPFSCKIVFQLTKITIELKF